MPRRLHQLSAICSAIFLSMSSTGVIRSSSTVGLASAGMQSNISAGSSDNVLRNFMILMLHEQAGTLACSMLVAFTLAATATAFQRPSLGIGVVLGQPHLKDRPERTQGNNGEKREEVGCQHFSTSQVELNSPANPMNAIDSIPAMIRFIAVPWINLGMLDSSDSSRSPASRTRASVNPNPAPSA